MKNEFHCPAYKKDVTRENCIECYYYDECEVRPQGGSLGVVIIMLISLLFGAFIYTIFN